MPQSGHVHWHSLRGVPARVDCRQGARFASPSCCRPLPRRRSRIVWRWAACSPTPISPTTCRACPFGFGAAPTRDTDGDGMPDVWESAMGLGVTTPDADGDPDGDGLSNREEFRRGLAPPRLPSTLFRRRRDRQLLRDAHRGHGPVGRASATTVFSFMREDGSAHEHRARDRSHGTIGSNPADVLGPGPQSFATLVESDQPIAADRLVTWARESSGHAERGLRGPVDASGTSPRERPRLRPLLPSAELRIGGSRRRPSPTCWSPRRA